MYLVVNITTAPSKIGFSYKTLKYAKYGVVCWEYDGGFRGPPHWINWMKQRVEQDWQRVKPVAYSYYFYPGVYGTIQPLPTINTDVADAYINGVAVNLLTGKGIPILP